MENKINIVVICAMGMSSSLLANKISIAAQNNNIDAKVECYFISNFKERDYDQTDVILLAPQVRNNIKDVENFFVDKNKLIMNIDMEDYGLLKGEAIVQKILKKMEV